MARNRQSVPNWIKDMLPKKCYNCGSKQALEYHHIVPRSVGGQDIPSNIAVLCSDCHSLTHYGKTGVIVHSELVREAIKKAKDNGVVVGRPRTKNHEAVMRLIAEKSTQFNADSLVTEHEIMEEAGVKGVCYAECKRELFEAMKSPVWPYEWEKPMRVRNRPLYDRVIVARREGRGQ